MTWELLVSVLLVLPLASLLDVTLRAMFWPTHACRLLDAAAGARGAPAWHSYLPRLRLGLALIAVCAVIYLGFTSALLWIPSNWGWVNDGDWTSARRYVAGILTLLFSWAALGAFFIRVEPERES